MAVSAVWIIQSLIVRAHAPRGLGTLYTALAVMFKHVIIYPEGAVKIYIVHVQHVHMYVYVRYDTDLLCVCAFGHKHHLAPLVGQKHLGGGRGEMA